MFIFTESNCYEFNPFFVPKGIGICLSCIRGYTFDEETNECKKCKKDEYGIIISDFENCDGDIEFSYCDKYITYCEEIDYEENIICPDEAPFFDNLTKSCNEFECVNGKIKYGTCYPYYSEKYESRILFINWFYSNMERYYIRYPNNDIGNTDWLLFELTITPYFKMNDFNFVKSNKRKFYFYNEERWGLFDEINDVYEKFIKIDKNMLRFFSSSVVLGFNEKEKFRYFANFEILKFNAGLFDINTGKYSFDNLLDIRTDSRVYHVNYLMSWIQILKLSETNKFLFLSYVYHYRPNIDDDYNLRMGIMAIELNQTINEKISVYSLKYLNELFFSFDNYPFHEDTKFFAILTKKQKLFISAIIKINYELYIIHKHTLESKIKKWSIAPVFKESFHKLLHLKDEKMLLAFYPDDNSTYFNILNMEINEFSDEEELLILNTIYFETEYYEGSTINAADIILLNENKAAFVIQKWHGKRISIRIINFFDDYDVAISLLFNVNIYEQKMIFNYKYSFIFKYREFLGLNFENIKGENGFILFSYFNSTDPKQIFNIKTDGLNYKINLGDYLKLQSNVFGYEKKCIKIIEVPKPNESGIFLISNSMKNIIKKDDCLDFDTEIKINFAYNGIINKGNYLFKFCGVAEELTIYDMVEYLDGIEATVEGEEFYDYIEIYNEQINRNITGRVSLVQINVLNDIKVFCDDKYNQTSLKSKEGKYITCGDGEFYDVINQNEITQKNLGDKYYFDENKKIYIKCHERCKKCSKEYNDTNMNCDECYDNYFLRNGICLEISKCDNNNYYYDIDLILKCLNIDSYCPHFKPYENNITKECIEECNINDLKNKICNPTNNPISINETYKKILNNINHLNLENKLLKNKEKYIINGNNVSFIFTTSDIEKNDLYKIYNGSSIILNKCENILKKHYLISESSSIPILKIEKYNKIINNIDIFYELFNTKNFSQKLDINLCSQNYIEIRLPLALKKYKMDLVLSTSNLGYNIFNLNDSFYNDICSIFTYNNSDFSLSERKLLLDLTDENICVQAGCNFSDFDIVTLRTICECKIGNDINNESLNEIEINNNEEDNIFKILKENINFSQASNIRVVKCFSKVFHKQLFSENYGFYIMFFMLLINILLIMLSFQNNFEKKLNFFVDIVIKQMKIIYDKKQEESNLIINNDNINNNEQMSVNTSINENNKKAYIDITKIENN